METRTLLREPLKDIVDMPRKINHAFLAEGEET